MDDAVKLKEDILQDRSTRLALLLILVPLVYAWPVVYMIGTRPPLPTLVIFVGLFLVLLHHLGRPITLTSLGFNGAAFLPALRLSLYLTVPVLLIIFYTGLELNSLQQRQHPHRDLFALFLWALAQQWALQTVLFETARRHWSNYTAILVTATVFGMIHLPNPLLTVATFAGALGWCWIYSRHPNLIPLAVSHSLCSLMMISSLPREVTGGMRIGYAYFLI